VANQKRVRDVGVRAVRVVSLVDAFANFDKKEIDPILRIATEAV
jgi:hypothetical protein